MTFVRPLGPDVRVMVVLEGRPMERYAVMLQLLEDGTWRTVLLFDNAHGTHDIHEYTRFRKRRARPFIDGSARVVVPAAIQYLDEHWEELIRRWKS